jgi:hypothetical protein
VVRLLVAAGVRVVGLDPIEDRCQRAEKAGAASMPLNFVTTRKYSDYALWLHLTETAAQDAVPTESYSNFNLVITWRDDGGASGAL